MLWTGDGWVMVVTEQFGDLTTMRASPEVGDIRLQALRSAAHHSLSGFLAAAGDDDALRMWLSGLSEAQQGRMQHVLARMRG